MTPCGPCTKNSGALLPDVWTGTSIGLLHLLQRFPIDAAGERLDHRSVRFDPALGQGVERRRFLQQELERARDRRAPCLEQLGVLPWQDEDHARPWKQLV